MNKKIKVFNISILVSILIISTILSGCSVAPASQQEETSNVENITAVPTKEEVVQNTAEPTEKVAEASSINVWVLGNSGPGVEYALPGFQEKYPNISVNLQVFGWNDLVPKLQAALTAGEGAPDVVELFGNRIASMAESGAFMALNDYVEPYKDDLASYAFLDTMDKDGNIYAMVWSVSPGLLFYRSDIFEAEGIDPASIKTWDDLLGAGKEVTHGDQYMFLTASQSTQPQYFNYFTGMLSEYGGSPFDAQGNITINDNNNALKVLQTLEKIRDAKISLDVDAWWTPAFETAIKSGHLASLYSGSFHVEILKETDPDDAGLWRVQLAPTFADGTAAGIFTGAGRGLVIPEQSNNKDSAWTFIKYMMLTPEGAKANWEGGAILPVYKAAFDEAYWNDPDPYYGDQAVGTILTEGLKDMEGHQWFTGPIPSSAMANEIVGPELQALMTNKINAQTALDNILEAMKANMP